MCLRKMFLVNRIIIFLLLLVLCSGDIPCNKARKKYGYVCVCNATYCDTISTPEKLPVGQFHLYSTSNKNPGFNHVTGFFRMQSFSPYGEKYVVNITKRYQTIRGFGATFTDSFGAVYNKLSNEAQENLMKSFFSEDGIEYTLCRVVFASSDFALRMYSYLPDYDPSLKSFNLTEDDYLYKIPQIKKALNITKRPLNLLGTTWTSPEWMKVNNKTTSEFLRSQFRQLWADYHIKVLDAFKAEGIEFWGITTGNEPVTLYEIHAFIPNLVMFPEEQREWVIYNLGPAMKEHNYTTTKIIIMDDERLYALWWMETVMRDPLAKEYVHGIGLHWYFDSLCSPTLMDEINIKFPGQEILYTESSINPAVKANLKHGVDLVDMFEKRDKLVGFDPSRPELGSWRRASLYIANIIENMSHWVTTYIDWNLSLDLNGGPNEWNFSCDASIIINETGDEFYKQPIFYAMGHFSKFMPPGSIVIDVENYRDIDVNYLLENETQSSPPSPPPPPPSPLPGSTTPGWPISSLAPDTDIQKFGVLNPDGSRTIIYYNPISSPKEIVVFDPDRGFAFLNLEPNSISTLIYW